MDRDFKTSPSREGVYDAHLAVVLSVIQIFGVNGVGA